MALLVPTASQLIFLDNIRTAGKLLNAKLALFVSNHIPVIGDVIGTYTAIEAAFGGYAQQTITDWGAAVTVAAKAQTTAGVYTFTATGAGLPTTVYGVFVTSSTGELLYAELNPTGGVTLSAAGHAFSYQPVFTLTTG
jgi:hypothetical protein